MKVHHLNCGTMNPPLGGHAVCHVLLLETENGLALVDTGFGRHDIADPRGRIGPSRHLVKPRLVDEETAAAQITALGFDTADVRDIVATHLDYDHIGGASDFPHARLHTTAAEAASAYSSRLRSRLRYNRSQLPNNPAGVIGHPAGTDTWRGFSNVTPLPEIGDGIALIPLAGHTRGHAAVAVDAGHRWIMHSGDAFYHHQTVQGSADVPRAVRMFERLFAEDHRKVRENHALLQTLYASNHADLLIVCAHDPTLLEYAQQTA